MTKHFRKFVYGESLENIYMQIIMFERICLLFRSFAPENIIEKLINMLLREQVHFFPFIYLTINSLKEQAPGICYLPEFQANGDSSRKDQYHFYPYTLDT